MDVEISCVTCLLHTIFENIMGLGEANDEWGSISTTDLILNLLEISVMVFNQQILLSYIYLASSQLIMSIH